MPTLDWRNRDEATKTAARVLVRALIEIPELGCTSLAEAQSRGEKCCQCDNVASANFQLPVDPQDPLETGNNGTGNTSTLATLTRSPVLGIHEGVAYALLYNGILHDRRVDGGNVLTRRTLALIREDLARLFPEETPKRLTVFAEWSRLGPETLAAERIEFRQTPYDLKGGR